MTWCIAGLKTRYCWEDSYWVPLNDVTQKPWRHCGGLTNCCRFKTNSSVMDKLTSDSVSHFRLFFGGFELFSEIFFVYEKFWQRRFLPQSCKALQKNRKFSDFMQRISPNLGCDGIFGWVLRHIFCLVWTGLMVREAFLFFNVRKNRNCFIRV